MASREQHNREGLEACENAGVPAEWGQVNEINQRIDQFSHYPDMEFLSRHRKFLHHKEGVAYFARRYGKVGKIVAETHIITDCGHIPAAKDYYIGKVDEYGGRGR